MSNPDPETTPPPEHNPVREYNSPEEGEEDDEGLEQETPDTSSGLSLRTYPPITNPLVSVPDASLTSPYGGRRGSTKRKKGKRPSAKKQQAISEKMRTLVKNLNPVPFIPSKLLDFGNHEKLLKKLGLWDFVHIDFDRSIRIDLIAQLVASYDPKSRASYVNGYRFMVNRADLAHAVKLPLKRGRGNVGRVEVNLDMEVLSEDSIGLVDEILSDWMLLHDDLWVMPNDVTNWLKLIKDGHPEKVDWPRLLWLMVEKELKQGGRLRDCYYASHLQRLIKFQRKELFFVDKPAVDEDAKEKEEEEINECFKVAGAMDSPREVGPTQDGPSTELTLGQDGDEEDGMKDAEMIDVEKCEGGDEEGEQGHWLLNGMNDQVEHFMQPCVAENAEKFGSFEYRKNKEKEMDGEEDKEEGEDEAGNDFHVFQNDDVHEGDGFTGNLIQAVEGNQTTLDQVRSGSSMNVEPHVAPGPSFVNNAGKRLIEHDDHMPNHSMGDDNKRLRIADQWDNKPSDLRTCMDQIQQMMERARVLYVEQEQAMTESNMHQQILLSELQKRDSVIEHLHKSKMEEGQKKDREIYRLERELYLMGSVLHGYRKALKDVKKAFAEYKERAKLLEEPTYKETRGRLMLTAPELENLQYLRQMNDC